jgi:hypothetical protein
MRTAKEVLEDHLNLSKNGAIEEDLKQNYAEEVLFCIDQSALYLQKHAYSQFFMSLFSNCLNNKDTNF